MNLVVNMVERIIMEKMTKLQDTTRLQVSLLFKRKCSGFLLMFGSLSCYCIRTCSQPVGVVVL